MKVRTTALVMAMAMSVSVLSACGSSSDASASSTPSVSVSTPAVSSPAQSTPAETQPEVATPDLSAPAASTPEQQPVASLALNKSDFTLFKAGETYPLVAEATGTEEALVWTSSDETVATVAEDGTVTAVAPGSAIITVSCGELTAPCTVRCDWVAEEQPETETDPETETEPETEAPAPDVSVPEAPEVETPAPSTTFVDLAAFYNDFMLSGGENSPAMMEVTGDYLDGFYPGLAQVTKNQCVVYTPMISAIACEIAMVECANAADVETVKAIMQARIDSQVAGGAWYPETIAGWQNNSKIVVNGNYVALFVIPDGLTDAAAEFNNRF